MIIEQFAHLLSSPLVHSSSSILPTLPIILSTFESHLNLPSVSLQVAACSVDYLTAAELTIVVLIVLLSDVPPIVVLVTKRLPGLFLLTNYSLPTPCPWWSPNRLRHTGTALLGHWKDRNPLSKLHWLSLFVRGIGKVDKSFSFSTITLLRPCVLGCKRHPMEVYPPLAK